MSQETQEQPSSSTVRRLRGRPLELGDEQILPDPNPSLSPSNSIPTTPRRDDAWKGAVIGSVNVLAAVLAARFILLLATVGGAALTWLALAQPDVRRLAALAIYTVTIELPLVWLASKR